MDNEEKDKFLLRLEEAGESQVRVNIASNVYGQHPNGLHHWIRTLRSTPNIEKVRNKLSGPLFP